MAPEMSRLRSRSIRRNLVRTMNRGFRIIAVSGLLVLLLGCATTGGQTPASATQSHCGAISYGAITTCYAPAMRMEAERGFAVRPIDPSAIVFRVAGLRLARVVVYQLSFAPHAPGGIEYDYGVFPASWHGAIPSPLPMKPRILVISENAPVHLSGPWRVSRTVGHLANGKVRRDPWHFYAHNLDVGGSVSRLQVKDIGLKILGKSR